jgi:hypothetical protein
LLIVERAMASDINIKTGCRRGDENIERFLRARERFANGTRNKQGVRQRRSKAKDKNRFR